MALTQPPVSNQWIKKDSTPESAFGQYMVALDKLIRGFTGGNPGLIDAASDAAAAAAGVQIGQLYRTGNSVQIRLV